jgi:hypothetical protein
MHCNNEAQLPTLAADEGVIWVKPIEASPAYRPVEFMACGGYEAPKDLAAEEA